MSHVRRWRYLRGGWSSARPQDDRRTFKARSAALCARLPQWPHDGGVDRQRAAVYPQRLSDGTGPSATAADSSLGSAGGGRGNTVENAGGGASDACELGTLTKAVVMGVGAVISPVRQRARAGARAGTCIDLAGVPPSLRPEHFPERTLSASSGAGGVRLAGLRKQAPDAFEGDYIAHVPANFSTRANRPAQRPLTRCSARAWPAAQSRKFKVQSGSQESLRAATIFRTSRSESRHRKFAVAPVSGCRQTEKYFCSHRASPLASRLPYGRARRVRLWCWI